MITITLPWPDRRLSPNAREHWAAKSKLKAWERFTAKAITLETMPCGFTFFDDIALTLEFCPPNLRRFDRDNALASMKAQLDGVADALGIDDSRFEPITLRRGEVVKGGAVIVRIGA